MAELDPKQKNQDFNKETMLNNEQGGENDNDNDDTGMG